MTTTFDKVDAETYYQWLNHRDLWTIAEGIQLFMGMHEKNFDAETKRQADELLARAERSVISGRLCIQNNNDSKGTRETYVVPTEFVRWLSYELGHDIPDGLKALKFMSGARHIDRYYDALDRTATGEMRRVLDVFNADKTNESKNSEDAETGRKHRERMTALANKTKDKAAAARDYWQQFIDERDELVRKGTNKSQASRIVSHRHPEEKINSATLRQK